MATVYICTECSAKGTKGWFKTDRGLMHRRKVTLAVCGPVRMMRAVEKGSFGELPGRGSEGLLPEKEEL